MNELLDRRERPEQDRRLRSHSARCEECRDLLELQIAVFTWSVPGKREPVGPGSSPHTAAKRTRHRPRWVDLAIGVSLLGCVLTATRIWSPGITPRAFHPTNSVATLDGGEVEFAAANLPRVGGPWPLASPSFLRWGIAFSHVGVPWEDLLPNPPQIVPAEPGLRSVEDGFGPLVHTLASTLSVLRSTWPLMLGRRLERAAQTPDGRLLPSATALHAS